MTKIALSSLFPILDLIHSAQSAASVRNQLGSINTAELLPVIKVETEFRPAAEEMK